MYTDTPVPQEEPAGQNPPDGAIINYYLQQKANSVSLDILDAKGTLIRKYTDKDTMYKIPALNIPLYWIRPQQILSGNAGSHRFLWDMRYAPLNVPPSYPISATYMNTAPNETSPWALPGIYTAKLTVDGKTYSEKFEVKMDPRVKTNANDLESIKDLAYLCYDGRKRCMDALKQIGALHAQIKDLLSKASPETTKQLNDLDKKLSALENTEPGSKDRGFNRLNGDLAGIFNTINESDMPPTTQTKNAALKAKSDLEVLLINWMEVNNDIKKMNVELKRSGLDALH